jgi:3-deoxy-manno-octulosonate cytidylyltransferase (CMP-KDO synthetase)
VPALPEGGASARSFDAPTRGSDQQDATLIVIPARYASTRLPGKPLLPIAGRTLLARVVAVARAAAAQAGNCSIVVATDDDRIAEHARELAAAAVMTPASLDSGSARAFAAATAMDSVPSLVVNLQGDAPFIPPGVVAGLIATLRSGNADVATPVYRLDWDRLDRLRTHKQTAPFSGTTCVRDAGGNALWFSKAIIPAIRNEAVLREAGPLSPIWQHLGLYGYRMAALEWFAGSAPTPYEQLEGLEQLRFLEGGRTIATFAVEMPQHALSGIDTPVDLAHAEAAIARLGDPYPQEPTLCE